MLNLKGQKAAEKKLNSGEWTPAPWNKEYFYVSSGFATQHYTHISTIDPEMVAFIQDYKEDEDKFRITSVKPGRYLQKFFGHSLSSFDIRVWSAQVTLMSGKYEVKFASTPDEIEDVYVNGPSSCMGSRPSSSFRSKIHPARIYGAGDLAVAYLSISEKDAPHCKYPARVLVWPEKKIYGAVYGDGGQFSRHLINSLEKEGYQEDCKTHSFEGAKCLKIPFENGVVAPYLDVGQGFNDEGNHLTISYYEGDFKSNSQTGVVGVDTCRQCDEEIEDGDSYYIHDVGDVCYDCFCMNSDSCIECGENFLNENLVELVDSYDQVCTSCRDKYCKECEGCENYAHYTNITNIDGGEYCSSCAQNISNSCDDCGELFLHENLIQSKEDYTFRCSVCHEEYLEDLKEKGTN